MTDGGHEECSMRNRLVTGDGDLALKPPGRLDQHRASSNVPEPGQCRDRFDAKAISLLIHKATCRFIARSTNPLNAMSANRRSRESPHRFSDTTIDLYSAVTRR